MTKAEELNLRETNKALVDERDKLREEKAEIVKVIIEYLVWGAMTQSDRNLFDNRFKKIIEKATGRKWEEQ